MRYFAEERHDGFAVIGAGNERASDTGLTEAQAGRRAHFLAGDDGYVEWKGLDGKFEKCPCQKCKKNRR